MARSIVLLRNIIGIQIVTLIATYLLQYRHQLGTCRLSELPSDGPDYPTGLPVITWKLWPGTEENTSHESVRRDDLIKFILPWFEYYTISHRLGYRISFKTLDGPFFQCLDNMGRIDNDWANWCNIFRQAVPYRISNYEDADISFTDYIPGLMEHVNFKANLVSRGGKYLPRGFHLPKQKEDFLKYTLQPENKHKMWIQKHPFQSWNILKKLDEIDFSQTSLMQEFLTNPYLIDGKKFSIGVYVAFSSAKPLRAYVYTTVLQMRFCSKQYNSANFTDPRSYISDGFEFEHQHIWEIESLKDYNIKQRYSNKQSLDAFINLVGGNSSIIENQVWDAIRDVLYSRKDLIAQTRSIETSNKSRYFQPTRWDFILDSDLKLHLMEANINPSWGCNGSICNNVMYNTFRAMGIESFYDFHKTSIHYVVRNSDVYVENEVCYTPECTVCRSQECRLCPNCLTDDQIDVLKSVLWENTRKGEFRLVYPDMTENQPGDDDAQTHNPSKTDDNELTRQWLRLKCNGDIQWCNQ